MRFTIRDTLWLMALAGVLVAWWLDRNQLRRTVRERDWQISALIRHLRNDGVTVKVWEEGMFVDEAEWDDGQSYWYPQTPGTPFSYDKVE